MIVLTYFYYFKASPLNNDLRKLQIEFSFRTIRYIFYSMPILRYYTLCHSLPFVNVTSTNVTNALILVLNKFFLLFHIRHSILLCWLVALTCSQNQINGTVWFAVGANQTSVSKNTSHKKKLNLLSEKNTLGNFQKYHMHANAILRERFLSFLPPFWCGTKVSTFHCCPYHCFVCFDSVPCQRGIFTSQEAKKCLFDVAQKYQEHQIAPLNI